MPCPVFRIVFTVLKKIFKLGVDVGGILLGYIAQNLRRLNTIFSLRECVYERKRSILYVKMCIRFKSYDPPHSDATRIIYKPNKCSRSPSSTIHYRITLMCYLNYLSNTYVMRVVCFILLIY